MRGVGPLGVLKTWCGEVNDHWIGTWIPIKINLLYFKTKKKWIKKKLKN
jgi:hypothetical protein